jgi:hypothetical protein
MLRTRNLITLEAELSVETSEDTIYQLSLIVTVSIYST